MPYDYTPTHNVNELPISHHKLNMRLVYKQLLAFPHSSPYSTTMVDEDFYMRFYIR